MSKVLKVSYGLNLVFKTLKGSVTEPDFSLDISEQESIDLLSNIRCVIRGEIPYYEVKYSNIELGVAYTDGVLVIQLMECRGEQSRFVGKYLYDTYLGGYSLLDGLREEAVKIQFL